MRSFSTEIFFSDNSAAAMLLGTQSNQSSMAKIGYFFPKNAILPFHFDKSSDGDFSKYFHLPVSVNFGKWILFTGKLPVNKKNQLTP
jgi:hypothetical protein